MSKSSTKTLKRSSGFTLIELLVSMTISLAVLAAVAKTFTVQTRQNGAEEQMAQMQQNVRGALDLMVREIQMAKYDPGGNRLSGRNLRSNLQRFPIGNKIRCRGRQRHNKHCNRQCRRHHLCVRQRESDYHAKTW